MFLYKCNGKQAKKMSIEYIQKKNEVIKAHYKKSIKDS